MKTYSFLLLSTLISLNCAYAATYYVDASFGDNLNDGLSELAAFKTIQNAADIVQPGDTVKVKAGFYNEFVIMKTSGTEGAPIIFEGEMSSDGEWLSTIDPSTDVSTGWEAAPEIGEGVYKQNIGFNPLEMMADYKSLSRILDYRMGEGTGFEYLAKNPDADYNVGLGTVKWWDGLEAMYGYRDGITYIRFRNGDDPNNKNIRATPNNNDWVSPRKPAVMIHRMNYITVKNFAITGALYNVSIAYGGNNIIENNYITNGQHSIGLLADTKSNIIRNNEMTYNYFGYDDPGAWGNGEEYKYLIRNSVYSRNKFLFRMPTRIRVVGAGDYNEIYGNHIFKGLTGISILLGSPTRYTKVYDNSIHGMSSTCIDVINGQSMTEHFNNLIYDCNINLRFHHMNTKGEAERTNYIYLNKFWNPEGIGKHIHAHWWTKESSPDQYGTGFFPTIWVYHNSFSGGQTFLYNAGQIGYENEHILPNVYFVNNIISSERVLYFQAGSLFYSDANTLGGFDYNWLGTSYHGADAPWFGTSNIISNDYMWSVGAMPATDYDFTLPAGSAARQAGVDVSAPFTLGGQRFDALPGMEPGYFNGAAPDIGAVQTMTVNEPDGDGDGIVDPTDNCTLIPNADQLDTDGDGYGNLCDGDLNNDGSTNTLDLNLYKPAHRSALGDANYDVDADFNGDGVINTLDLNIYKGLHRQPPGPSCCGLF